MEIGKIFNRGTYNIVVTVGLIIAVLLWLQTCNSKKDLKNEMERQEKIAEQNTRALTDSLRYVKNKAGEIEAVKSSFVAKLEDLEKLNKDLYLESKKEIGNLKALIKGSLSANVENVAISNELKKYPDGKTYGLLFEKTVVDTGMTWSIKGESKFKMENNTIFPGQTDILNNQMKLKLVLGFKENKEHYEVYARSANPNVKFDELSGVMFIPKKADPLLTPPTRTKRFGLGVHLGYGAGLMDKRVMLTPVLSVGIQYNIIKF